MDFYLKISLGIIDQGNNVYEHSITGRYFLNFLKELNFSRETVNQIKM